MNKKSILTLAFFLILLGLWSLQSDFLKLKASEDFNVYNLDSGLSYATIQAAINAPETIDGDTIFVAEGIYYENVVVNKSIELEGADWSRTIIDGNNIGNGITIASNNVTIREIAVRNSLYGVIAENSNNVLIVRVNASFNDNGIFIKYSHGIIIQQCIAGENTQRGIFLTNSDNFTVTCNSAYHSGWYGLNVNASISGVFH